MANAFHYLRLSLLPACNFNCFYCRPPSLEKPETASLTPPGQFKAAIELLHSYGVRKVQFTGGEPTLYPQLPELLAHTKRLDQTIHVGLTSNAYLLERLAHKLQAAGLDSINISLDTINREKFRRITNQDGLPRVLAGLRAAIEHIPKVKLNCVVIGGVNTDEIASLVGFADEHAVDIRFIEYMPSRHGTAHGQAFVPGDATRDRLAYNFYPVETNTNSAACYYQADDLRIRVGFINPVSHPFCADCDRIRLTADGNVYGCLFSRKAVNLFDMMANQPHQIAQEINKLIEARTNVGCTALPRGDHYLPSFIVTGG